MYNRYIPADDGTYRRQVVEERHTGKPAPAGNPSFSSAQHPPKPVPHKEEPPPPAPRRDLPCPSPPKPPEAPQRPRGLSSLFSGLDHCDIILILLLILLVTDGDGDCDNTSLLLTIALYFLLQ